MSRKGKFSKKRDKGDKMKLDVENIQYNVTQHPRLIRKANTYSTSYREKVTEAETRVREAIQTFLEKELPVGNRLILGQCTPDDIVVLTEKLAKAMKVDVVCLKAVLAGAKRLKKIA